ncbi:class I SAM-dependent methyltransferase [Staphylococcus chromogenes]|uniref:hypothetical protein n=1 Tax=Staphylococcus chromogenes TaxID=46126 RepID=UPI00227B0CF1|nr:hypothetical protein [Staphylococcus chromogenes]WAG30654.1 hypothetical protein LGV34_00250 [Staphylococcus chromogenes]
MAKLRLATVFSGIGAIEHALERLNIPYDIIFASDNGDRNIDIDEENVKNKLNNIKKFNEKKSL